MKYHIKIKKKFVNSAYVTLSAQAKYKYLHLWLTVSDKFERSDQAEAYIS